MTSLLCRPTQSGKTFNMISKIEKIGYSDNTCHIIIVSNNLLETIQMNHRLNDKIKDKSFILSSKSECVNILSAIGIFLSTDKRIMICCKNSKRLNDIDSLVNNKMINIDLNIWVDEADDMIASISPHIDEWIKSKKVKQVTMITATPKKSH